MNNAIMMSDAKIVNIVPPILIIRIAIPNNAIVIKIKHINVIII